MSLATAGRRLPALVIAIAAFAALAPAVASAWAPASTAKIHPGVQTNTDGTQCTSNFVFSDGASVYLGQAAHCSATGAASEINGCINNSKPLGTPVTVAGATRPGTLVYNSWSAMHAAGETSAAACNYNDFALVRLDSSDFAKVNPSVPGYGGPNGIGGIGAPGSDVFSYQNSSLRFGVGKLSPHKGRVNKDEGAWSDEVVFYPPAISGDSGSGVLNATGKAAGVVSTLRASPTAGTNGVSDLGLELSYMRAHSGFLGVGVVLGTEAFDPDNIGAIVRS